MPHFPPGEWQSLSAILRLASNQVLELSHPELRDLVRDAADVDLDAPEHAGRGSSSAKRLESFLRSSDAPQAAAVIEALSAHLPSSTRTIFGETHDLSGIIRRLKQIGPRPGLPQRKGPYFIERTTAPKPSERNVAFNRFHAAVLALVDDFEKAGWFAKHFGQECLEDRWVGGMSGSLPAYILRSTGLELDWPIEHTVELDEPEIFTLVEFLFDHASEPVNGYFHGWNGCGMHWEQFHDRGGREHWRDQVNLILETYGRGFHMSEVGQIQVLGEPGLARLHQAPIPSTSEPDRFEAMVEKARDRFLRWSADPHERRIALGELAHALEALRSEAKTHMMSEDERRLFEIANQFSIRHNNAVQRSEYNKAIWHSWFFYLFLSTCHLLLRLRDQNPDQESDEDA